MRYGRKINKYRQGARGAQKHHLGSQKSSGGCVCIVTVGAARPPSLPFGAHAALGRPALLASAAIVTVMTTPELLVRSQYHDN